MRYETASSFRTALEDRLRAAAPAGDASFVRLRRLVIFERLLARLLIAAPGRWVVKGGLSPDLRLGTRARATRDLDLARDDDEAAATADLLDAQAIDLGDFFAFSIERTDAPNAALEGATVRYRVAARLAGRRFGEAIIDVGFGDPPVVDPDYLEGFGLLAFAGFGSIRVPALPLEQHVAEKVHAYTRPYEGQRRSSRVKDLIDLVLIPSVATFAAGRLRRALRATFDTRDTHPVPTTLPAPPPDWGPAYRATAQEIAIDPDIAGGGTACGPVRVRRLRGAEAGDGRGGLLRRRPGDRTVARGGRNGDGLRGSVDGRGCGAGVRAGTPRRAERASCPLRPLSRLTVRGNRRRPGAGWSTRHPRTQPTG